MLPCFGPTWSSPPNSLCVHRPLLRYEKTFIFYLHTAVEKQGNDSGPSPSVTFTMQLQRHTTYYIVILILPCISNVMLTLLVFLLPTETGERIGVGINTLFIMWVNYLRVNITSRQYAYIISKLYSTDLQICPTSRSVRIINRWTPKNWYQSNCRNVGIWEYKTLIMAMIFHQKFSALRLIYSTLFHRVSGIWWNTVPRILYIA